MNLGKLLAAGKSIISGRVSDRYRKNKKVYLPKFAAAKNPFVPANTPTPELPRVVKSEPDMVAAKTRPLPTMRSEAPEQPAPAGWVKKISAISIWRGWQAEVKAQQPTVQAELSLESVKVVHNDLSDTDVEVVPIKSRPLPSPAAATPRPEFSFEEKPLDLMRETVEKAN
jgi:hypothetical protein